MAAALKGYIPVVIKNQTAAAHRWHSRALLLRQRSRVQSYTPALYSAQNTTLPHTASAVFAHEVDWCCADAVLRDFGNRLVFCRQKGTRHTIYPPSQILSKPPKLSHNLSLKEPTAQSPPFAKLKPLYFLPAEPLQSITKKLRAEAPEKLPQPIFFGGRLFNAEFDDMTGSHFL